MSHNAASCGRLTTWAPNVGVIVVQDDDPIARMEPELVGLHHGDGGSGIRPNNEFGGLAVGIVARGRRAARSSE